MLLSYKDFYVYVAGKVFKISEMEDFSLNEYF
jgi:hypothetical protein